MINTFFTASKIKRAYTINETIYRLRSLPVIGKIIPYSVYSSNGFIKVIAGFLYVLQKIATFCTLDFIYIALLVGICGAVTSVSDNEIGGMFVILYFFFGLAGILINNILFDVSEDKYYGIILMHLDAKKYVLSNMLYTLLRKFVGHLIALVPVTIFLMINPFISMALLSMTILGKFLGAYIKLKFIEKDNQKKHSALILVGILVFIAAGILFAFNVRSFSNLIIFILTGIVILLGSLAVVKLMKYNNYLSICKKILTEETVIQVKNPQKATEENAKKVAKESLDKNLKLKENVSSSKSGYAFFNDLFVKRHANLLGKRTRNLSIFLLVAGICLNAVLIWETNQFGKDTFLDMNLVIFCLPIIMYFINTGEALTTVMFANCDAAMLTYNFYKNPKTMLGVFTERLKTVIINNLIPTIILAADIDVVCYFVGEVKSQLTYVAIPILCLSLSVFFSVHRLVIYYLLQPYTIGLQKKSAMYSVVNSITYIVCYMLMISRDDNPIDPIIFSFVSIGFSVLYVAVALPLVYKLAPKRFKIHK